MEDQTTQVPATSTATDRAFLHVEHAVYAAIGLLLATIAVVALLRAGAEVAANVIAWNGHSSIFETVDQLLFVLMLVEILHTVRVSIRSGNLNPEPFLIVGLIASIRRVLVITLQSSQNPGGEDHDAVFKTSMIELGVLAALILTMVVSIMLIRWSDRLSARRSKAVQDNGV